MEAPIIYTNKDITSLTTFGIPVKAAFFAEYENVRQLLWLSRQKEFLDNEVLHIGGGSNLLFLNDFKGLVLHSAIKGIVRYDKSEDSVFAIVGAGVKWTDFVDWCVCNGLGGVENLAGIPGEVGASAVQNVGAYGVEAKDVIHSVECFDTETRKTVSFRASECEFGYRDSRFKHDWKGRYVVTRVGFKLKNSEIASNLSYGPLQTLEEELGHKPTICEVKNRVEKIRNEKLPSVGKEGSAGSFFKNPVVSAHFFQEFKLRYPSVRAFNLENGEVKIPAAWLIENAGLKDARIGGARIYPNQCLVISNYDHASANDVKALADLVVKTVRNKFYIYLKPEVNYIDTSISVKILGSGTSKGVPEIGCNCEVCSSKDPHDNRLRASVLVQTHGMNILIDSSPDMRQQLLQSCTDQLDCLLLTHIHYDHIGGLEDLRTFCGSSPFDVYAKGSVIDYIRERLAYCFVDHPYPGIPRFEMHEVTNNPFFVNGLEIIPIEVLHGEMPIFGYRIGRFAYVTDAKRINEIEKSKLEGLEVLIINALRGKDHFAHFTLQEALDLIADVKPEKAYLTHLSHEIGLHSELERRLPDNVFPAYDGLEIKLK